MAAAVHPSPRPAAARPHQRLPLVPAERPHPPPAAANGYTSGGHTATIDSSTESGGTYTLACTTDVVITATAGGIGPFRYVILYNDTSATDLLIGYWDYGSSITLNDGETFTIDVTASLLTIT